MNWFGVVIAGVLIVMFILDCRSDDEPWGDE